MGPQKTKMTHLVLVDTFFTIWDQVIFGFILTYIYMLVLGNFLGQTY